MNYLPIKDVETHEIASYFTLKAGLFTLELSKDVFYTIPLIELSNFAVNSSYRKQHPELSEIGKTTFREFVRKRKICPCTRKTKI